MKFLGKWNTIRVRLTLLYSSAFFLAGLVFIGFNYYRLSVLVSQQRVGFVIQRPPGQPQIQLGTEWRSVPEPERLEISADIENSFPNVAAGMRDMDTRLREQREQAMNTIAVTSVVALVALVLVAGAFGWLVAGQALQPLRQITATARAIADRNLHQRVGMQGPQDEIKDLADTLDAMLERLDRAFDSQQRFIANASHELRTPLAINRTLIEVALLKETGPGTALTQLGTNLLAINQRHERLIDGLLMLASSEQIVMDPQNVDLAEVARHVLAECSARAHAAGVDVRTSFEGAPCTGDPVLLERLVQNLVDNALRYNLPEGGWVSVATGSDAQGRARFTVENPGPVIPSFEVPRLFEPFRRLASTERQADAGGSLGRRGAGLGLSIVRSVVTSHGGEVSAVAREAGGLSIDIFLPQPKP